MDVASIKEASGPADDGVWVGDDIHSLSGVRLRVKPMSAASVQRELGRRTRTTDPADLDADGNLTDEAVDRISDAIKAEIALVDWDGLTSDGKPLAYTAKAASELLTHSVFWTAVTVSVAHVGMVARDAQEKLAKNLPKPSPSKSKAA